MTSEIRANIIKNRVGLGTIEYSNTGPVISGVTTASNFKTGSSNLHSTGLNVQDLDVDGHTNLDNVSIAGISTFSGSIKIQTSDLSKRLQIGDIAGSPVNYLGIQQVAGSSIKGFATQHLNASVFENLQGSIHQHLVLGDSEFNNTGTIFGISITQSGTTYERLKLTGVGDLTVARDLNVTRNLDVDGHTNLDNVSIAGITTFSDDVKLTVANGSGILLDKSANQFLINTGTYVRFQNNSEVNTDDGKIGTSLFASGLNIVGSQTGSGLGRQIRLYGDLLTNSIKPTADSTYSIGTSSNRFLHAYLDNIDVDGHTNLDNVSISGVSTFTGRIDASDNIAITSGNRLYFGNSDVAFIKGEHGGSGYLALGANTEHVRITRAGRLGIGTDNPEEVLHIQSGSPVIKFSDGALDSQIRADAANLKFISGGTTKDFMFQSSVLETSEVVRITGDGNFGIGTNSPVARLHVHNSGTTAADHAYAFFTTGDTGSSASDGLTVGVAANQVASVNYREAGTLTFNTSSSPRITILSTGQVGINNGSPSSNTQLSVVTDGLDDNTYAFATEYRSGNNASGYSASGIVITSKANNSNGEDHTAYIRFDNRTAAQNGAHGVAGFITLSTPDSQGTYGTGEYNFYCRNGAAYSFPNDPAVPQNFWMSSLLKIKSTGELFGYGNLRIDTGSTADGIIGKAYGTSYFGIKQADQGSSEYMMINNNTHTFISCSSGCNVYIRPSANSQSHETVFAHDNTTFKSNIVMDNHQLRRNQHHSGHMEGGHNNIGSTQVKTSPIYTIGSSYNPNENDLNNMYGIGYCHSTASFINSNVTGGWGQYIASDGDARIFLNAGDGIVYATKYGRMAHNAGHLLGSYNNIGANDAQTNPIYTIGLSYNPNASTLSNMYGIGYSHGNASFTPSNVGWGLYVAADGDSRIYLDGSHGNAIINGSLTQNASDVRLKTNIKVIDNPIEKIKKIRGVTFDWVDNITSEYDFHPDSMHETGVIAQEIQEVIPDAVTTAPFNGNYTMKSGTDNNYLTVKNEKIIPLCIEAIKKLTAKVESLEQENTALKARVTSLEE